MNGAVKQQLPDEPPPLLGTWGRVYTAVLALLAAVIGAMYLFTRALSL